MGLKVTLVPLSENPEKFMGPEWKKEGTEILITKNIVKNVTRAEPSEPEKPRHGK